MAGILFSLGVVLLADFAFASEPYIFAVKATFSLKEPSIDNAFFFKFSFRALGVTFSLVIFLESNFGIGLSSENKFAYVAGGSGSDRAPSLALSEPYVRQSARLAKVRQSAQRPSDESVFSNRIL